MMSRRPVSTHTASPTPSATPTSSIPAKAAWGQAIALPSGLSLTVTLEGPKPATGVHRPNRGQRRTLLGPDGRVQDPTVHNNTTGPLETSPIILGNLPIVTYGPDGTVVPHNDWDGEGNTRMNWPTLEPGESYTWEWGLDDGKGIPDALAKYQITLPQYQGGDC